MHGLKDKIAEKDTTKPKCELVTPTSFATKDILRADCLNHLKCNSTTSNVWSYKAVLDKFSALFNL